MESTPPGRIIRLRQAVETRTDRPATGRSPASSLDFAPQPQDLLESFGSISMRPHLFWPDVPGARRPHSVPVLQGKGSRMIRDARSHRLTEPDSGEADHVDVYSGRIQETQCASPYSMCAREWPAARWPPSRLARRCQPMTARRLSPTERGGMSSSSWTWSSGGEEVSPRGVAPESAWPCGMPLPKVSSAAAALLGLAATD
eukprot:CAMPEP_0185546172 /NCGR_PEP_ID=MMETSP1381-20130426/5293_1 /TAXON_ID=298111 /ORGANISM="Pavlova sp., Strain CCMP459" /LENGTH=200 /DNA_ID=CAMNT_0028158583 /DNA_START=152 /DNA_END=753 /DNA_ORIENTATION=+